MNDGERIYKNDAFNRVTRVETTTGQVQINRYDAEGLRYEMEENKKLVQFIFNENREVVVEKSDSDIKRLIRSYDLWASECEPEKTWYHYASDEQGSTVFITDDNKVCNRYDYDAWGNLITCEEIIPNRFLYTGQQFDQITQQYYLRARYYSPVIARFTKEDVYRGDGLNLYTYCDNNPVIYYDPSGYACNPNFKDVNKKNPNTELYPDYKIKPNVDVDYRGQNKDFKEALNEAFIKTNTKKEDFKVTKWGKDKYGKSFPVEWRASNGAEVNVDLGHTSVGPTGPRYPHIGYQTGGKRRNKEAVRGHILLDDVPYNR